MKYVAPGVYTLEGLLVGRVYLIEDPDGLTIIDGSIGRSTATILKEITSSGHKLVEIKRTIHELQRDLAVAKTQLASLMNLKPGTKFTLIGGGKRPSKLFIDRPVEATNTVALRNRAEMRDVSDRR